MSNLRAAAQQALEALEELNGWQSLAPPVASQAGRQAAINLRAALEQPEQEPAAWRNAALRVGEDLCSVGPFGYYNMTAKQWLDWALSVVTVHAPPRREWRGLTEEEIWRAIKSCGAAYGLQVNSIARAIEAALRSKNHE
jgi:hypothetical protein